MEVGRTSRTVAMLGCQVRAISCNLTNITPIMEDHLQQFPKIREALVEAIKEGRQAAQNLQEAISPSIKELDHLYKIADSIARKKKESTYTWWIWKHYHYQKACKNLRKNVDFDKLRLNANDPRLLQGFQGAIDAYENVIRLCNNKSKYRISRLLQTACSAAVAILTCARVALFALQLYGMVTMQPLSSSGDADALLKELIEACRKKKRSLVSTLEANKQLMERTKKEAQEMQLDMEALDSMETDLSELCELAMEARNSRRNISVLLRDCKVDNCRHHLHQLRDSCEDLINRSARFMYETPNQK